MTDAAASPQLALDGADMSLLQISSDEGGTLSELDSLPVREHVRVFTVVHEGLQRELAAIDAL